MDPSNRHIRLAFLVLLFFALVAPFAHSLEKQPASTYHARRVALAEKLQGGAAVLFAAVFVFWTYYPRDSFPDVIKSMPTSAK